MACLDDNVSFWYLNLMLSYLCSEWLKHLFWKCVTDWCVSRLWCFSFDELSSYKHFTKLIRCFVCKAKKLFYFVFHCYSGWYLGQRIWCRKWVHHARNDLNYLSHTSLNCRYLGGSYLFMEHLLHLPNVFNYLWAVSCHFNPLSDCFGFQLFPTMPPGILLVLFNVFSID